MSQRPPISEEEFKGWLSDPVTQAVLHTYAQRRVEELQRQWASGSFTYPTCEATMMKNACALGEVTAWGELAALDYDALMSVIGEADE